MTRVYRRLPGARRGLIHGSSAWIASDHILAVKSMRFREEYKRFHLRDVQAVAVAKAPRFHISTRAIAAAAACGLALLFLPAYRPYLYTLAALLVGTWLFVSAFSSCRCRIYTAVSSDELPSVYRSWTARKFLAAIEQSIGEVQGVLEGEWAEAVETRDIGPPLTPRTSPVTAAAIPGMSSAPRHTVLADIFVAVLFFSGLYSFLTLGASPSSVRWGAVALMLAKVALAIAIFVQHYQGKLAGAMQKVAIATLLAMGSMYYVQQMAAGFAAAASTVDKKGALRVTPTLVSDNRLVNEINGGASLALAFTGLGVILLARDSTVS